MSSLLSRLNKIETQLKTAHIELASKNAFIESLQQELAHYKELSLKKDNEQWQLMNREIQEYKAQMYEMQTFLQQKGFLWKQEKTPLPYVLFYRLYNIYSIYILKN